MSALPFDSATYAVELEAKANRLRELLAPFDAPEPQVFDSPLKHFRLRAEFRLWREGGERHYAMFAQDDKRTPILIEDFPIASLRINQLMPQLKAAWQASSALSHKLFQVEFQTTLAGDAMVTLCYHRPLDEHWQTAAEQLAKDLDISVIGRSKGKRVVIGRDHVVEKLEVTPLATAYLGTRQVMLREDKNVMTPADLKGVKLRMPASKEWLFLGEALGATPTPLAFGEVYLALKTGTIDGQDNPLPSARAAKFYEVSKTVVLTGHLVDGIFLSYATKAFNALTPEQQKKIKAAAQEAAAYNNENRIKDEASITGEFKDKGLKIVTPNVDAFRKEVQDKYLKSDYAKIWPKGLLEKINAVK